MDSRIAAILMIVPACAMTVGLKVEEVLSRYDAALGGREALKRVETMEMFGTVEGMGLSGTTYSVQKDPQRIMERIDIGPLSYAWAHTEAESWIQDQSGVVRTLSDVELEEFLLLAQIGGALPMGEELKQKMQVDPALSDSSHVCIAVDHDGQTVELYFEVETGLLDRVKLMKLGMPVEARFSDFRLVEGLRVPFQGIQTVAGLFSLEMKVTQVRVNAPVSDSVFQRPGSPTLPQYAACAVPISVDGHIIVPVTVEGTQRLQFFLDSGAGMSCIDERAASRLGFKSEGALPAQGVVGFDSVGVTIVDALGVGCVDMRQVRLAVVDLSPLGQTEPGQVHGILGYGLFSQRSVGVTGGVDSLSLGPPLTAPPAGYVKLPLQFVANVPVIDATVNGRPGRFLVDTGNSFHLILHTPFAQREGIVPSSDQLTSRPAAGIGGGDDVMVGQIDSLTIAGIRIDAIPTLFSPSGRGVTGAGEVAGNIGLPLLQRFDWVLDYQGAALYLRRRT